MKTISSKNIIGKVYRDFGVNETSFVNDAIEWIGECLERIGTTVMYENRACKLTVCGYKACLPPNLENLVAVEYNGHRLTLGSAQDSMGFRVGIKTENDGYSFPELLPGNHEPTTRVITVRYPENFHKEHYYTTNPGYVITSFEEGEIILYYKAFPTDDKGFPMIWDNVYVREACSWLIISKMLLSGYEHAVVNFQYATEQAERFILLAGNANFPTIERMERFRNMWVRMIPDVDAYDRFFEHSEKRGDIFR